jgi:hypothetical protein
LSFSNALYGGRGLMTTNEKAYGYKHSHLSYDWNQVTQFCLGTGPINNYLLDLNRKPDENSLFSVLYNIKIYVEWESLEGTPYMQMAGIGKSEIILNGNVPYSMNYDKLFEEYIKLFKPSFKIQILNNRNFLKIDESIVEKQLVDVINTSRYFLTYYNSGQRPLMCAYRNKTTGKYYRASTNSSQPGKSTDLLLRFKGQDIYTIIYNEETTIIEDNEKVIHPEYTKKFAELTNRRISNYYLKKNSGTNSGKSQRYCL